MERRVIIEVSKADQEIIRKAASILRFMDCGIENETRCWSPTEMIEIANREYYPTGNTKKYFEIIYEE